SVLRAGMNSVKGSLNKSSTSLSNLRSACVTFLFLPIVQSRDFSEGRSVAMPRQIRVVNRASSSMVSVTARHVSNYRIRLDSRSALLVKWLGRSKKALLSSSSAAFISPQKWWLPGPAPWQAPQPAHRENNAEESQHS